MSTPITPLWPKKTKSRQYFILFCFALLSLYPVYSSFIYGNGAKSYERHKDLIAVQSDYFNPRQYRILCPFTIEGIMWVYNHTIDKVVPIKGGLDITIDPNVSDQQNRDTYLSLVESADSIKYNILLILFSIAEFFFIYLLSWKLWNFFVKGKWLLFLGVCFLAVALGNAVDTADLSHNTYMDIIFYLLTANLIVHKWSPKWLLLITPLAALNRETGILIPYLYFISQMDFTNFSYKKWNIKSIGWPKAKTWKYVALLYVIFIGIFIGLKVYYGYQPQKLWKVPAGWPMLKLNLISPIAAKGYMMLIGTFAVIPFIVLYKFKVFPEILKRWFMLIVPLWFGIHFVIVVAYQTRLFLVPIVLVLIPMMLWLVEQEIVQRYTGTKNET